MPQATEKQQKQRQFVAYLCRLVADENRTALAALRRGLGKPPGTTPEMFRYVEPWATNDYHGDDYYLVAALFALHPVNATEGNLGTTFATVARQGGHQGDDSLEKRFVALLNAHREALPTHLRHAVSLARSKDVRINWLELLCDVAQWGREDRPVQRRWAGQYWGETEVENADSETTPEEG